MLLALGKVALYNECMKTCPVCNVAKEHSEFHKNAAKKDGLDYKCKACKRAYAVEYVRLAATKSRKRDNRTARRIDNQNRLKEILVESKCADCSNDDWVVLEFDHLGEEEKTEGVGQMVGQGWPWETILSEIAKCDIVCANCHRHRTYKRAGSWRYPTSV